jgi:hypothetical protein
LELEVGQDLLKHMLTLIMTQPQELMVWKELVKKIIFQITLDYQRLFHFHWMVDCKKDVRLLQILGLLDKEQKPIKHDWTLNL